LFDFAHIGVAARPGFALDDASLPVAVKAELAQRSGTPEQLRNSAHGKMMLAADLAVGVSATDIRAALQRGDAPNSLISPVVLDYIHQHNLYKS
jgi:nicotinate-nucleotide adenylyltransferase